VFGAMVAENERAGERSGRLDVSDEDKATATIGFRARCLLRQACWATLATQSEGQPTATLVTQAIAADGAVLMLLSSMAEHARHLEVEPRCSVMAAGAPENLNWQTAPRVTVNGTADRLNDPAARRYWVARHPYARLYADFSDFSIWRMVPEAGLFVAGFGQINRLTASQLTCPGAAVAGVAAAEASIIGACNADHGGLFSSGSLSKLAHAAGYSGRWTMLGVDPDGFDLTQDERVLRIAFDAPVWDGESARAALIRLLKAERNGHFTG
jgi:putative heme iron utilization protein